jgi:hypothetical protein
MAFSSDTVGMGESLQEARPIKINLDELVENKTTSDPDTQRSATMVQATITASSAADVTKLKNGATFQPTTSILNSSTKADDQVATESTHVALPGSAKPQTLVPGLDVMGAELLSATCPDTGHHWTTRHSPARSALEYTQFKRPSPEQISSIFPSELPSRPLPKRSFLQRLADLPRRPIRAGRRNGVASNEYAFRTPDIELGPPGEVGYSHGVDPLRRLKFWGLMLIGVVLSAAIGILIYSLVRHVEENDMK